MKPTRKQSWLVALGASALVLGFAQLLPVDRENPPVESDLGAPPHVAALLRSACYDCHSNETEWPAYARVAPVSWFLARDVRSARRELNFSLWSRLTPEARARARAECADELSEREMPPRAYALLHRDARLSPAERELLVDWLRGFHGGSELVAAGP